MCKISSALLPRLLSHRSRFPFSISNPLFHTVFSFSFSIILHTRVPFSSVTSTSCPRPPSPLSVRKASCQPLMLALTVSRLQSQEGDLQESKMARHGRSSQCHNTQRTLSGHARINRTSIHHLTCLLGLWRGLVHPRCMSEGFCGKHFVTFLVHLWATNLISTSSQNFLIYATY